MVSLKLLLFIVLATLNYSFCFDILNEIETKENVNRSCVFESVFAEFYDTQGTSYESVTNGCLTNTSFVVKDVIHIEISLQNIRLLERGSVGDLPELESILIIKSGIAHVMPGAFYNLPKIKNISLVFNDFREVKRGVFNDLPVNKVLISSPVLTNIEEYAFGGMQNLTTIAIHYSRILIWNKNWIGESQTLTTIDFRFGTIEVLPADAFQGLPNLKSISFRNNRIHTIENDIFQSFKNLDYLGLNSNNLTELNPNAFSDSTTIGTLNIERNKLNYLSQNFLTKVVAKDVYLWGNPWTCSCFNSIHKWLKNTNGNIHDNYNCIDFRNPVCVVLGRDSVCVEEINHEATKIFFRKFSQKRLCLVPLTLF